ncbi:hypothetical protein ABG775_12615 [Peribacillus simplex]
MFRPVCIMFVFDGAEEAIKIANDKPY